MKRSLPYALLLSSSVSMAGGLDRSNIPISKFSEEKNFIELGLTSVDVSISGTHKGVPDSVKNTEDVIPSASAPHLTIKTNIDDNLSIITAYHNSYGSKVNYQAGIVEGIIVDLETNELDILANYKFNDHFSLTSGIRMLQTEGNIDVVFAYGYQAETEKSTHRGYVLGANYEVKDIGFKASLTYQSEIDITLDGTERFANHPLDPSNQLLNKSTDANIAWVYPQAVRFDLQTGIAENTLLFASYKWSEWSRFRIAPDLYEQGTGKELVSFENDILDQKYGIGYRVNPQLSVMAGITYASRKGSGSAFSPNDGGKGILLGANYLTNDFKISAGFNYVDLNTVTLENIGGTGVETTYKGNTAIAYKTSIQYQF